MVRILIYFEVSANKTNREKENEEGVGLRTAPDLASHVFEGQVIISTDEANGKFRFIVWRVAGKPIEIGGIQNAYETPKHKCQLCTTYKN